MRNNNTPAAATQINNLIALAQSAPNEEPRANAIGQMWEQYGDKIVGIAAKQSYTMDSDFGYHGYSIAERRASVMGESYEVFRNAALEFDNTLGVPFMAHATNKVKWQLQTDKRENAKKAEREVRTDYTQERRSYKKKTSENDERHAASSENIAYIDRNHPMVSRMLEDFESDIHRKDAIFVMRRSLLGKPTLLHYFDTLVDLCHDGFTPTDAEAARHMDCTRATTSNYHQQLLKHLHDRGLYEECRMALAA